MPMSWVECLGIGRNNVQTVLVLKGRMGKLRLMILLKPRSGLPRQGQIQSQLKTCLHMAVDCAES